MISYLLDQQELNLKKTPVCIYYKDTLEKIALVLKNKKKKILIVLINLVKADQAHFFSINNVGKVCSI